MRLKFRCPLAAHLYRQAKVCKAEEVPFRSKIELMETLIRDFEPVDGTKTHILLDSWYCAKCLWRAARERDFLITSGLKSNRWLVLAETERLAGQLERARLCAGALAARWQEGVRPCGQKVAPAPWVAAKRLCEAALAVVWVQQDQATGIREGGLAKSL
jgi:hypothetical protein